MKSTVAWIVLTFASICFAAAPAPTPAPSDGPIPPTDAEVKRVVDYYMFGKGEGPVLVVFKPCLKIDMEKESVTRLECLEPAPTKIKKGTPLYAWTQWLVPKDDVYEDVVIQSTLDGQVRETKDMVVADGVRHRVYKSLNLSKPGKWTLKVLRKGKVLASTDVTVE